MGLQTQYMTAEQFDEFIQRPDLGDAIYEMIGGEIVEVPSNTFVSDIASNIIAFLKNYVRAAGFIGYVSGEAGGYWIGGERFAPDVAYISKARQPELAQHGYNPNPPELAVEVISDENNAEEQRNLTRKLGSYLAVGTVVWIVYPFSKLVDVHVPGQATRTLGLDDTLDGGEVLPGFTLAVKDIFES